MKTRVIITIILEVIAIAILGIMSQYDLSKLELLTQDRLFILSSLAILFFGLTPFPIIFYEKGNNNALWIIAGIICLGIGITISMIAPTPEGIKFFLAEPGWEIRYIALCVELVLMAVYLLTWGYTQMKEI